MSSNSAANARGSKRVACDRCREQKLKCPPRQFRDDTLESTKCARCAKAGAPCKFSTSMRAGRPNVSINDSLSKRRESKSSNHATPWEVIAEKPKDDTLELHSQGDFSKQSFVDDAFGMQMGKSSEAEVIGVGNGHMRPADGVSHVTAMGVPNGARSDYLNHSEFLHPVTLPGTEEGLVSAANAGFSLDLEEFVHDYNWSLQQTKFLSNQHSSCSSMSEANQSQRTGGLGDDEPLTLVTPGNRPMGEACHMPNGHTSAANVVKDTSTRILSPSQMDIGETMGWESGVNGLNRDPVSFNNQDENINFSAISSASRQHNIQHRRMQELSELAMTLYSQVMETGSRDGAATTAHTLLHDLTGRVLKSSVKFLHLLTSSYLTKGAQSSNPPPHVSSSDDDLSPIETSELQPSPSCEPSLRSPLWENSSSSTVCNSVDEVKAQQVDMTEVFALLTCYIRILHLHSLLYSQFSDFLVSLSERGVHMPPLIPGMQIGGVSLDDFGKFQIKFLLQVSTHVLGEIEIALGLPDGHRISKKDRHSQGILEESVSTEFIEMTMGEKGRTGVGMEKDRIASIRNHISTLRQFLKGTINP